MARETEPAPYLVSTVRALARRTSPPFLGASTPPAEAGPPAASRSSCAASACARWPAT